ncbi:MAG: pyruvate dehydrogenase [Paracoccaceae bacterium]|nr:pyruvate dehydrogenase [Paracoccaceae bacterium]
MAHEVLMPALGMAQDSGVIVAWHKSVGDHVKAGELLMEVETDKAVMEVEAQTDGYLSEIFSGEGEDVPVGQAIAVIALTQDTPASGRPSAPQPAPVITPETGTAPADRPATASPPAARTEKPAGYRILASPKARSLAAERGLDLSRLVASGHPQPYHVADLDLLTEMEATTRVGAATATRASAPALALQNLFSWLETEIEQVPGAVLAAFAAASYRAAAEIGIVTVLVREPTRSTAVFVDPDRSGLAALVPTDTSSAPDLVLNDLTSERGTEFRPGEVSVPEFSVAFEGDRVVATLAATTVSLDDDQRFACLDDFVGRLDEPLRHLL